MNVLDPSPRRETRRSLHERSGSRQTTSIVQSLRRTFRKTMARLLFGTFLHDHIIMTISSSDRIEDIILRVWSIIDYLLSSFIDRRQGRREKIGQWAIRRRWLAWSILTLVEETTNTTTTTTTPPPTANNSLSKVSFIPCLVSEKTTHYMKKSVYNNFFCNKIQKTLKLSWKGWKSSETRQRQPLPNKPCWKPRANLPDSTTTKGRKTKKETVFATTKTLMRMVLILQLHKPNLSPSPKIHGGMPTHHEHLLLLHPK